MNRTHFCVVCETHDCHNAGKACASWCGAYYRRSRCVNMHRLTGQEKSTHPKDEVPGHHREDGEKSTLVRLARTIRTSLKRTFCLWRNKGSAFSQTRRGSLSAIPIHPTDSGHIQPAIRRIHPPLMQSRIEYSQKNVLDTSILTMSSPS